MFLVVILSEREGFIVFSVKFIRNTRFVQIPVIPFLVFLKKLDMIFCVFCFVYNSLFVAFQFLRKLLRSQDLLNIALKSSLLKKGILSIWACFLLHRGCLFNLSNPILESKSEKVVSKKLSGTFVIIRNYKLIYLFTILHVITHCVSITSNSISNAFLLWSKKSNKNISKNWI